MSFSILYGVSGSLSMSTSFLCLCFHNKRRVWNPSVSVCIGRHVLLFYYHNYFPNILCVCVCVLLKYFLFSHYLTWKLISVCVSVRVFKLNAVRWPPFIFHLFFFSPPLIPNTAPLPSIRGLFCLINTITCDVVKSAKLNSLHAS